MPATYGKLNLTIGDASNEKSTASVYVDPLIASGDVATLRAAILAVSMGNYQEQSLSTITVNTHAFPTNEAEREEKLLIRFQDDTTLKIGTFTIPCFEKAGKTRITGTDYYSFAAGELATLATQIESFVLSVDGNAVTVISMQYVGRNT